MITYDKTSWLSMQDDGNIPEGAPPINANNLNNIEEGIKKCVEEINLHTEELANIGLSLKSDVIWENNEPNKTFAATKIEKDLSRYNRFSVLIKSYYGSDSFYCEYTISNKDIRIFLSTGGYGSGDYERGRVIIISDSGIEFLSGHNQGSTSSSYDSYAIPVKIIGYTY